MGRFVRFTADPVAVTVKGLECGGAHWEIFVLNGFFQDYLFFVEA